MRRDIIASVVLFFTFLAVLFAYFYPLYYTHSEIVFRDVSIGERIFSVIFVLLWITLCMGTAYFKKIYIFIGGLLYALIPYASHWGISMLLTSAEGREVSIAYELFLNLFIRIYEMVQAPLVGVSILFEPETGSRLSFYLLPILVFSYLGAHLFRFYRNAYLAEQLRLDDISPGLKKSHHHYDEQMKSSDATNGRRREKNIRQPSRQVQKPGIRPRRSSEGSQSSEKAERTDKDSPPDQTVLKDERIDERPLEE